jgi:hypothetical protein
LHAYLRICSIGISDAEGRGTKSDNALDAGNKQMLLDTFRNLVRYVLLKTNRDVGKFGVTQEDFSVDALDKSLAALRNAGIFGKQGAVSIKRLLEKAQSQSLTFHFYWKMRDALEPLEAAFGLSYEPDGDLKVMLLWLGLPEQVPVSPRAGIIEGRTPLKEPVTELLRFHRDGRLTPYPSPE